MNICVLFTGGTIGSTAEDGIISLNASSKYKLINHYTESNDDATFFEVSKFSMLSENMTGEKLNEIISCVKECVNKKPDGIIVTHGTDTLQYTCAALGYAFADSGVPIGVVSSNFPLDDERANGHDNFFAAVKAIKGGVKGVFAAYKNKGESTAIHCATRMLRHVEYEDEVYSLGGPLGFIENGEYVANPDFVSSGNENCDLYPAELESARVIVLNMHPNIDLSCDISGAKAILITAYHSGTIASNTDRLNEFCLKAAKSGVPIFLTGAYQGDKYESVQMFDKLSIKVLPKMSAIAAYVKLWLACSKGIKNAELEKVMRLPVCDDIVC